MNRNSWFLLLALCTGAVAGAAPTVVVNAPPSGAANVGSAVTLDLGVSGATGATTVTFYGRKTAPATPGPDFVLGTLPDTQYYSENAGGTRAAIFHAQTQWYLDNRAALNLAFVSHMGDFVQNGDFSGNPAEWQVADAAMARIENRVNTLSAFGIPWGGAPGNHDTSPIASPTGTSTFFNQYFGSARFAGREFYRGHYGTTNNNNYEFFRASGLDFIIIHLTYRTATLTTGEQEVLDWADALLKAYPDRRAIVTSHWILGTGNPAPFQGPGQRIYDNLKDNPNLFLLLCGHVHGEGRRTDVFNGNTVNSVLQDYQDDANGGDGWLRYFIFSPANNTISARTFSPSRNNGAGDSRTGTGSQFTLAYNQQGAVTGWIPLGTVELPAGGTGATLPWTGLETDNNYEWYVTATDSSGTSTTAARRFATAAAQAPVVTLTAPANNATFTAPGPVSLAVTATDADSPVARVEFYQGTTKLGEDTAGPSYDFTWSNVVPGAYALSAVAVDSTGRGTLSNVVNITVNPGAGGGSFTFSENFNAMGTTGTTPPAGWSVKNGASGTSTSTWTSTIPGTGSNSVATMVNAAGSLTASNAPTATNNNGFNAGAPGNSANRLLATSPTTTAGSAIQLQLVNPSGASIAQLLVGYDLQRFTAASSVNELPGYRLFYSLDGGTAWTNVAALNPVTSGTGVVVPNTTGVTTVAPFLVTLGSPWAAGATLLFRWVDDNAAQSSPDQVLGLDNVTVATPAVSSQPPTISDVGDQVVAEDTGTGALPFTVGDAETAAGSLTVSGSSSNPALVPNGNIVFGGSGAGRTVTVTPAANQSGTATITVTVSDGGATATDTFLLTVSAINDTPTIGDIANQAINEDASTGALAFAVNDIETAAGSLTVSGSSSNTTLVPNGNIVFSGSGASRTVTVTPAANQSGTATITVTVSDGGATATDTFLLTVSAINDIPGISDIANQAINEDTSTGALPFTVSDVETAAGSLAVSGSSSNPALVPNGNIVFGGSGATRTVTVAPVANQSGLATITVTVSDGSATATDTFLLTVSAINDTPVISDIADQSINEDASTGALAFSVNDVETAAGSLTVSGSSSNPALVPNGNIIFGGSGTSRTVTITPLANQSGTAMITVTVSDGGATATDTFLLNVNAVNDAPTITSIGNQATAVNTATAAINFTVDDLETAASGLTLSGTSSDQTLLPDDRIVFGGSGASRTVILDPATDQTGSATITLTVNDGEATAVSSFTFTVNPGTSTPLVITTDSLPNGAVNSAYAVTLSASGGTPPTGWSLASGSLPAGLGLNGGTGAIAGTPTAAGTFSFTVQATDTGTPVQSVTKDFSITIAPALVSITVTPANPTVTTGGATRQFTATATYSDATTQNVTSQATWSSSNPARATINATGLATSVSAGSTTISATWAAMTGSTTLTVQSPLAITTNTLPGGTINTVYSAALAAGGGTLPYDWSLASGSLPAGLVLNGTGAITGTPTAAGAFSFTPAVTDSSNPLQTVTKPLSLTIAAALPVTIWASSAVPLLVDAGGSNPVELGVKFRSDVAGTIIGIRFYKAGANTGTHTGSLWSANGTMLATATFSNETASGWQQVTFSTPVSIAANTVYVASYHSNTGHYSFDSSYFASAGVDNPPLHALSNSTAGGNGVYLFASGTAFPSLTYNSANYWVDVVFQAGPAPTLASIAVTPANPTILTGATQQFTATGTYSNGSTQNITSQVTWSSVTTARATINAAGLATGVSPGSTTISAVLAGVTGSTGLTVQAAPLLITTASLPNGTLNAGYSATLAASGGILPYDWSLAGGALPAGLVLNGGTGAITGTPTAAGAFSFTPAVTDSGNPLQTVTKPLGITIMAVLPVSIWSGAVVPATVDAGASNPVELGVKFRSDVAGTITGIRFYKASANTGTHTGSLWSVNGTLLATATFSGETASGWQQVTFLTPVPIAANTVYVASYHCNTGHYSFGSGYFASTGVDNPPLHALSNSTAGGNGVYLFTSGSAFPSLTYNSSNYWVDVVFQAGGN